jgi:predicted HTH transcriptional regulator
MVLLGFGFSCFPCLSYLSCFPRQRIENWLYRLISPKINFEFHETEINSRKVVLLEIEKATEKPVQFSGTEYIRIGTYKKALKEFPGKERELWRRFDLSSFEDQIAKANIDESELLKLLDYPSYFDLMDIPLPEERKTAS